jgi:hypothetical protein
MARGLEVELKGTKLHITIDTEAQAQPSSTGKTQVIASTEGNVKIMTPKGDRFLGLNFYRKA